MIGYAKYMELLITFGFIPSDPRILILPLSVFVIWLIFLPIATLKRITIFYNASLRVSFWEEIVFRGFLLGGILLYTNDKVLAVIGSSLIFGVFHMRNMWWAGFRRSANNSIYAGLFAGPIFAIIRILTGSIYAGILVHFLHNLFVMLVPRFIYKNVAPTPTNEELRAKSRR